MLNITPGMSKKLAYHPYAHNNLFFNGMGLANGKIAVTVASNNLTVAVKGLDGNDANSTTNVITTIIGNTVREITAALAKTVNAGANSFNAGSDELKTKAIGLFVYASYNATDGVVLGYSRYFGRIYSDFSSTATSEKYIACSGTSMAASDPFVCIGYFEATLSGTPGFTWTVPTFTASNLVQGPVTESRPLDATSVLTGMSASTFTSIKYIVQQGRYIWWGNDRLGGTSNATTFTFTLPWTTSAANGASFGIICAGRDNSVYIDTTHLQIGANQNFVTAYKTVFGGTNWTAANDKHVYFSPITTII